MASDDQSRDGALRALLVSRPSPASSPRGRMHGLSSRGRQSAIVTAVVLVAVVAASTAALQIQSAGRAPVSVPQHPDARVDSGSALNKSSQL